MLQKQWKENSRLIGTLQPSTTGLPRAKAGPRGKKLWPIASSTVTPTVTQWWAPIPPPWPGSTSVSSLLALSPFLSLPSGDEEALHKQATGSTPFSQAAWLSCGTGNWRARGHPALTRQWVGGCAHTCPCNLPSPSSLKSPGSGPFQARGPSILHQLPPPPS